MLVLLLVGACGGSGTSADAAPADAPPGVDAGPISGCTPCQTAADCGSLECIRNVCEQECQSGAECPSWPGGSIAECGVSIPDDAGVVHFYCAGGCPP